MEIHRMLKDSRSSAAIQQGLLRTDSCALLQLHVPHTRIKQFVLLLLNSNSKPLVNHRSIVVAMDNILKNNV